MSQSNIPSKLPSVERLIQRVVSAEKTNQKEIRLSIEEARSIVTDLSILTSKLGKHIEEIHSKIDNLSPSNSEIKVQLDGGSF